MIFDKKALNYLLSTCLLLIAYFTYFRAYQFPDSIFWDENFHIASAYKYLSQQFFMEPHPPLGKLIIALGEWLLNPNSGIDTFSILQSDYIDDIPDNFSFKGVRFFPALFAFFSVLIFFQIVYHLIKNYWFAFLLSSFYLFENAFIVHSRAAMLESIQIFFVLGTILYFLIRLDKNNSLFNYCILALLVGLTVSIKVNGLILILLFPFLFYYPYISKLHHLNRKVFPGALFYDLLSKGVISISVISFIFGLSYYMHFQLANNISDNYYDASPLYIKNLKNKEKVTFLTFWQQLDEHLMFTVDYEERVPKYKYCNDNENGSLAFQWPFMNKPINYRWEKEGKFTHYLYLTGNPLIWFFSLIGLILALVFVLAKIFF